MFRAQRTKLRAHKRIFELETIDQNKTKVFKFDDLKESIMKQNLETLGQLLPAGVAKDECKFEDLIKVFNITLIDGLKTQDILHNSRKLQ